jgi:Mg2+/Co2+ transporter CorB
LLTQLHQFQVDRQRLGLVVDEYGELKGLVSIEDILEEIVGEFTTQGPGGSDVFHREPGRQRHRRRHGAAADAQPQARHRFPLEGPKTLNGLIVEYLGEIPDSGISFRLAGQGVEVLQVQDRAVKVVKLLPPVGRARRRLYKPPGAGIIDKLTYMPLE